MTETTEVPALELGQEQKAEWREARRAVLEAEKQEARQAVAELLRGIRQKFGKSAWSKANAAEREYEQLQQQADPPVRAMTVHEQATWAQRHQRPDRDPAGVYTHRANLPTGTFSVTVEPCLQRWGLHAHAATPDGRVFEALISCADQAIATQLAHDIAEKGVPAVGRLQDYATRQADLAAAARSELRETEDQRLARIAAAVHEAWPGPLAAAVTGAPAPGYNLTTNPAFEALTRRLRALEERGYAPVDVLRSIDPGRLLTRTVENPAALATSFVKKQQERLSPVNLDGPGAATAAGWRAAVGLDDEDLEVSTAVDEILAGALSSDERRALQSDDDVRRRVQALYSEGLRVETLLHDLPAEKILAADNPGRYLAGAIERRAEHLRPSPTGVDQGAMAAIVRRSLEQPVADKVVNCRAWPGLAKHLEGWQQDGMPVETMLESLPVWDINHHRRPALYTTNLMYEKVDEHLVHQRFSRYVFDEITPGPNPGPDPAQGRTGSPSGKDRTRGDQDDLDIDALVENSIAQARQQQADAAAEDRAATHELDTVGHRSALDDPDTDLREDHLGDAAARIDEHAAASERATAAEQRGTQTAAATRAEVTYTPPEGSHDPKGPPARPAGLSPARLVPNRTPTRDRSQERRR